MAETVAIGVATGLIAGAALCAVAGIVASRWLRRLTERARGIAAGRERPDVVPRPPAQFGDLADALNRIEARVGEGERAAGQERERVAAVLDSTADAIIAVDREERVLFANVAAERLLERPRDELIGQPFAWAMPQDEVLDALRASGQDGRTALVERPNRRYFEVATTPIVGGGEWAALIVCHDLTDVKRTEDVRRDFVANVSHELRTPLAAIKSVIETLQGGALEDRRAARDFLARADSEVDRLVGMVEELLELSRIESGGMELARQPVAVSGVLSSAVERLRPYAEQCGLRLTLNLAPDLPAVSGDPERLERAVANLVRNAIEFTPSGGSISVSSRTSDGALIVRVEDSGVGIAPEDRPRVFERFFKANRARGGGTGLGLAIVKHTVEAHGGSVAVESDEGRGSTFTIRLPLADQGQQV